MAITFEDIQRVNSEIKMTDIGRGKEYAEVPQRIKAFRKLYPDGSLTSEITFLEAGMVIVKATACDDNGKILATGHAYEKEGNGFINKTSYIENCESSAWGRCLAACGIIGGADDTTGSVASAEEVLNAQKQQHKIEEEELKAELKGLLQETNSDVTAFLEWCTKRYEREIKAVDEMYDKELKDAIKTVKAKKEKK